MFTWAHHPSNYWGGEEEREARGAHALASRARAQATTAARRPRPSSECAPSTGPPRR